MSRELVGSNGNIVGSERYCERLNKEHFIGTLMRNSNGTEYYDCLRDTASQIRDTVQEIYEDLKKHIGIIRYIPRDDRENLIKVLLGLYDICKITSAGSGRYSECVAILSLSDSDTRPKSRADDREIEEAASMVRNSSMLSRSDRMDVIREAMNWGERAVSGNLQKVLFLRAVGKGKDREFFGDVWLKLLYADDPRQFTGRCGRVICTQEYIDHIEQHIFGRDIPNYYGGRNGDRAYGRLITSSLESIVKEIERDLEQGIRDNDYMQDENADRLKEALKDLERCGVQCYSLERKIDDLSWFVGGDPEKIRQLQQKLNELGIGERLEEDGVYGKKTRFAWENYLYALEHGSVPTLMMSDPLRSKKTGFEIGASKYGKQHNLQNAIMRNKTHPYIRIDPTPQGTETAWVRGKKTQITYPHINFDPLPDGGRTYNWIQERYNHKALTAKQYDHLKDLQAHGKKVQFKGKILLVAGIALDALELGVAVHEDLTDADKKLGEKTLYTSISIGGRWAGSAIGAQIGAWAGTLTGPAAPVAVPVLSLVGGIAGSALAQLAVDISAVGD